MIWAGVLVGSVLDRISQTLLVDRLAIFLEDPANPGQFVLTRSMGVHTESHLDLSFLDPARPALARGAMKLIRASTQAAGSHCLR